MNASNKANRAAFELPLLFLKFGHISAIECVFALCLVHAGDGNGRGHVDFEAMGTDLDRSAESCRRYLHKLRRVGLLETATLDNHGGASFRLLIPHDNGPVPSDSFSDADGDNRRPTC